MFTQKKNKLAEQRGKRGGRKDREGRDDSFELSAADTNKDGKRGGVCVCVRATVETLRKVVLKSSHSVKYI